MEAEILKCCALNCESTSDGKIPFFRFPPERERRDYWLTVVGRDDLKDVSPEILCTEYSICSLHFDESYIQEGDEEGQNDEIQEEDEAKPMLEGSGDGEGGFVIDETGKIVYLQGVDFVNVKMEEEVDSQYGSHTDPDGNIFVYVADNNEAASAIANQAHNNVIFVKNDEGLISVFDNQLQEQNGYSFLSEQIKTERIDNGSDGDMQNHLSGFEDDLEEDEIKECLCDACGESFTCLDSLRQHYYQGCPGIKTDSENVNTFKCGFCDMTFTMFDQMRTHIRRVHMQPRTYSCDVCGAIFSHRSNLSRHKLQHCSAKKFQCDQCGKGFSQKSNLVSHQTTVHGACVRQAFSQEFLQRMGAERIHRKPKTHKCTTCNKSFVSLTGLKNHNALHTGIRPYVCDTCKKSFTLMSCLKTHMNTIHSDKKHYCELCGKSYQSEHYLKTHLRIHSGAKDYKCEHCSKCFIDQPSLKLHMRTHTGEKPFTCSTCSRSFTQQSHLKTHMRIHTGEKPYSCQTCGKAFRQLSNVLEHSRTHKK